MVIVVHISLCKCADIAEYYMGYVYITKPFAVYNAELKEWCPNSQCIYVCE